jgi:hypothetical protein
VTLLSSDVVDIGFCVVDSELLLAVVVLTLAVVVLLAEVVLVIASVVLEALPEVVVSESLELALSLVSVTPVASDLLDSLASALDSLVTVLESLMPELDSVVSVLDSLEPLGLEALTPLLVAEYEEVLDSGEESEVSVTVRGEINFKLF